MYSVIMSLVTDLFTKADDVYMHFLFLQSLGQPHHLNKVCVHRSKCTCIGVGGDREGRNITV